MSLVESLGGGRAPPKNVITVDVAVPNCQLFVLQDEIKGQDVQGVCIDLHFRQLKTIKGVAKDLQDDIDAHFLSVLQFHWVEHADSEAGGHYYHNQKTNETTWDKPREIDTQKAVRSWMQQHGNEQPSAEVVALNLANNRLSGLTCNMEPLKRLKVLNLSRNVINSNASSLSTHLTSLKHLPSLLSLNISQNNLEVVPPLVVQIKTLQKLDLSMNQIASVEGLQDMPDLLYLDLSGNRLRNTQGLSNCPSLTELNLAKNQLEECSSVALLTGLRSLNLSHNALASVHEVRPALQCLTSIESLNLTANPLSKTAHYKITVIDCMPSLQLLDHARVDKALKKQLQVNSMILGEQDREDKIQALLTETLQEYRARIDAEKDQMTHVVDRLKHRIREVEREYSLYEKSMEQELTQIIEYFRAWQTSDVFDRSDEMVDQWRRDLVQLEKERVSHTKALQERRKQEREDQVLQNVKYMSLQDKLYEISMKKPELWTQMKEMELKQMRKHEQRVGKAMHLGVVEGEKEDPARHGNRSVVTAMGHAQVLGSLPLHKKAYMLEDRKDMKQNSIGGAQQDVIMNLSKSRRNIKRPPPRD